MLWANVTIATEAGRHALRLAVVAAAAEALVQALQLYQGRWVTLTIFIVLKPDYRSTFSRGVQRALGTMLGAALGATAAQWSHPDLIGLVLAASISAAAAYAAFEVSYLLFSVLLTFYIMSLLVLLGMPAVAMAEARILDTLIGATLALIVRGLAHVGGHDGAGEVCPADRISPGLRDGIAGRAGAARQCSAGPIAVAAGRRTACSQRCRSGNGATCG